jgi:hypothetical protein
MRLTLKITLALKSRVWNFAIRKRNFWRAILLVLAHHTYLLLLFIKAPTFQMSAREPMSIIADILLTHHIEY